jgi:hypothetical protein
MAERDHTSMTQEKQIPIQYQTDEYRIQRALEAMEAAGDHEALGRAWKRTQDLRDHLTAEYDRGNKDAWQLAKKLHRALYSQQFKIGQNDASAS